MSELPVGWANSTLGEIGDYFNGRGFKKSEWRANGRPIIRIQNLTGTSNQFNHFAGQPDERYLARPGDILVSWAATLGVFVWDGPEAVINQHIFKVHSYIDRRFHRYLLLWVLEDLRRQTHGSGMVHITKSRFEETSVLVPALAEQQRIVATIEEQLSRLDAGMAALERVRQNLWRMRAAVLHAAVSGRLIPPDPAEALARDELDLLDDKRRFTKGLPAPTMEHQALPPTWAMAHLEDLAERVTVGYVGSMQAEYVPSGVPFLRSQNVRANRFDPGGLKYVSPEFHQRIIKSKLLPGDVVIVRSGSVGTACVMPATLGEANCSDLVVVQRPRGVDPHFLTYYMNSAAKRFVRSGQVGVALTHFNTKSVAALPIPLPPLKEQQRIVAETDRQLSIIDQLEVMLLRVSSHSLKARSSILAAAFSGKLVNHDHKDEPASTLLERIAAERASSADRKPAKARRQRPREAATT